MPSRMLYHKNYESTKERKVIQEHEKENYLAQGEWYLTPEEAQEAQKNALIATLEQERDGLLKKQKRKKNTDEE
jgi:hypothetical protein